ncbi:unnamed protein product [Rhodiola kirilowii]
MDPLFPVDDVSVTDSAWPASAMNRSSSEWAFQRFLDDVLKPQDSDDNRNFQQQHNHVNHSNSGNSDEVVEISKPVNSVSTRTGSSSSSVSIKPDDYHAALKRQLDLACAAVALSRKASVSPEPAASATALPADRLPRASFHVHGGSKATGPPKSLPLAQTRVSVDFSASNDKAKLPAIQVKSSTSGSSRDQSEDDELDGEAETTENMGRTDDKRARRMLSNRESARRSRRRKQEHMSELETQAAQLKVEHSSLLKNLNESNQKYTEASVNLRVLKADVETLRAKVMMAEEKVKRLTGLNTLQPFSDVQRLNMTFNSNLHTTITNSMLPSTNHLTHLPTALPARNSPSPNQGQ